jgi:hypothetical protein
MGMETAVTVGDGTGHGNATRARALRDQQDHRTRNELDGGRIHQAMEVIRLMTRNSTGIRDLTTLYEIDRS